MYGMSKVLHRQGHLARARKDVDPEELLSDRSMSGCATMPRLANIPKGMTANQYRKQSNLDPARTVEDMLKDIDTEELQYVLLT